MLDHKHMLGKAYLRNPPLTESAMNAFLLTLVEKIDMKVLIGPFSVDCTTLGNEGVTGAVVIETSHLSGHCWHAVDRPFMTFDCYSCVDFDPVVVAAHIDEHFDLAGIEYGVIDRNNGFKLLSHVQSGSI